MELNDRPLHITVPMKFDDFKNANIFITNAYLTPHHLNPMQKALAPVKVFQFLSEEKLRLKLEKVLVDNSG